MVKSLIFYYRLRQNKISSLKGRLFEEIPFEEGTLKLNITIYLIPAPIANDW